jgi:peptidoglycan/xylan/chitin deacetylase (PgdA/CDA1 family)
MFHRLVDPPESQFDVPPQVFQSLVEWFRGEGYTVDSFSGLWRRMTEGTLPERYAVITFDDGHPSALAAAETLAQNGMEATFFVLKPSDRWADFAGVNEIRRLSELAEVGSHGVWHSALGRISLAEAKEELTVSKKWLEDTLGRPVQSFSFPLGSYNNAVVQAAREAGYKLLGSSKEWWNEEAAVESQGLVNRVVFRPHDDVDMLRRLVEMDPGEYYRRRLRYELVRSIIDRAPAPISVPALWFRERVRERFTGA